MRLRTLELSNYRRFQNTVLEFPEGVIAVVGPNGAGKSTLLEAIGWCLFGHEAARTDKEMLRRQGAGPGEDVRVRLEFELDGHNYTVARRLRGRSQQSEAQVEVDGALVVAPGANSSELTSRHISKALGMDRRGFLATVFASQGDLSALSDATPGDRKRLILGLLGIDEVDAAIARARTRKRDASVRLETARRSLQRESELIARKDSILVGRATALKELEQTLQERDASRARHAQREEGQRRLAAARERDRELRARLEGLQRALRALEEHQLRTGSDIQLLERKTHDLDRERANLARFRGLDERLQQAEDIRRQSEQRQRLLAEVEVARAELERWNQPQPAFGTNGTSPQSLESAATEARTLLDRLQAELGRAQGHTAHLEQERRRLQGEDVAHGHQWREIADLGPEAPCPTCDRPLGDVWSRLSHAATQESSQRAARLNELAAKATHSGLEEDRLRQQISAARETVQGKELLLVQVRALVQHRRVADAEAQRIRQRIGDLEARLHAIPEAAAPDMAALAADRGERDRAAHALARLEAETHRLPGLRADLAGATQAVQHAKGEIESASRELHSLAYHPGSWEAAQKAEAEESTRLRSLDAWAGVLEERAAGLARQLATVDEDLRSLEGIRLEVGALEQAVRIGELLAGDRGDAGLLPEFKNHLIGRVRPALSRAASALVTEMTQSRYTEVVLEDDYTIRLFDGAQSWPIHRFSGGEADVVHLAMRLAVSELLAQSRHASRLRFVALDEVLASQDEVRRRNVLSALKGLGAHFRNVLLVTHLEEVRELVDHVIQVLPAADGTSRLRCSWTDGV